MLSFLSDGSLTEFTCHLEVSFDKLCFYKLFRDIIVDRHIFDSVLNILNHFNFSEEIMSDSKAKF